MPAASFFKPTGDGLLLVYSVTRETGIGVTRELVDACLKLESEFSCISDSDWLINFPVPDKIGVGIARGTATRLHDGEKTLDYSGSPLNLASRLMDLARPRGVVFDGGLGPEVLDAELLEKFDVHNVFVRGLAELEPILVYVSSDVELNAASLAPIGLKTFIQPRKELPLSRFRKMGEFAHKLLYEPATKEVEVEVSWPVPNGAKKSGTFGYVRRMIAWERISGKPHVLLDHAEYLQAIDEAGTRDTWAIRIDITYDVPQHLDTSLRLS